MKTKKAKKAKATAKKKPSKATRHEIVVKVQSAPAVSEADLLPLKEKSKYMIPTTWVSERQVLRMVQKTPPQHIYTRPAKGGGVWSYVTGTYVTKVLNFVFGWNWDFEIVSHGKEAEQVWVLGKLTVKDEKGHQITKTQFGRADVKFKRDTKIPLDFGNDLKAASTDALKKCASQLGIASDIYGKAEFKEEADVDVATNGTGPGKEPVIQIAAPAGRMPCEGSDGKGCPDKQTILPAEAVFSRKLYQKALCQKCQSKQTPAWRKDQKKK